MKKIANDNNKPWTSNINSGKDTTHEKFATSIWGIMNPGSEPHKKTSQSISQVVIPPRDINNKMKLDILKQCITLLSMVHNELNLNSANREFFLKELYTLEGNDCLPSNISTIKNDLICILDIRQDCSWGEIIEYMETLSIYETWFEPNKLKSI